MVYFARQQFRPAHVPCGPIARITAARQQWLVHLKSSVQAKTSTLLLMKAFSDEAYLRTTPVMCVCLKA